MLIHCNEEDDTEFAFDKHVDRDSFSGDLTIRIDLSSVDASGV